MTVYVVIGMDRHSDPAIRVFSKAEDAIKCAMEGAAEYAGYNNQQAVSTQAFPGVLYHGCYSCEGDYMEVKACEVEI